MAEKQNDEVPHIVLQKTQQKTKKRKILVTITIVLLIGMILTFLTPFGALVRMDIRLMYLSEELISTRYRQTELISGDLIFTTISLTDLRGKYDVVPLFLYRDGIVWRAAEFHENARRLFKTSAFDANNAYLINETFVQKLGGNTIIVIGSNQVIGQHLTEDSIYDNLETEPILVSKERLGLTDEQGQWISFTGVKKVMNLLSVGTGNMSPYCYLFVIKYMPDDYEMHCGDKIIDKAYIDDLFAD